LVGSLIPTFAAQNAAKVAPVKVTVKVKDPALANYRLERGTLKLSLA
jgi:hypothetical protein